MNTHKRLNVPTVAALVLLGLMQPALATPPASDTKAAQGVSLTSLVVEDADENRFFLRTGGIARDDVTYDGVTPGHSYTLVAQLYHLGTQELTGAPVLDTLTPDAASGQTSVMLPVPANRTRFNVDYAVYLTLYEGQVDPASVADATPLAEIRDTESEATVIQVHAVQRVTVTAADAADGDRALPGKGGSIAARVDYENLVEGYPYTIWGELMKTSGQSTGIFASIADYRPKGKNGSVTLEFTVPDGFEGVELVPSVGLYHMKRVSIGQNGGLQILPDAPNPVMIASDPNLNVPAKTIAIGTLFQED
ncbi:VaFE repeat-containing surface-anchored protein [Paracoccus shanxieyensis]|uniref:VaFE repeat-containing surface-anchored protein n=1 Tax=Paracoccus shanxieyensis TaxID=2675752 RepID=A0A6L6J0H7_9RHOB|nr:VaFE repeat-containing surface-anchored protein [Paracoccus shanxieyensis]MTH66275.1 VaFE repeat-containing surface-anchored protein [Paracoccus shanxieyensis]MTH89537.1 VaFE repeat-containing surface-anchored protein [Paracoccus shanxieyensis]